VARKTFDFSSNNTDPGFVSLEGYAARGGKPSMTTIARYTLRMSAAAFAFSLALGPAAFGQDAMMQDYNFKSGVKEDGVTKDTTPKNFIKKSDAAKRSTRPREFR
jgi:pentapeptide MXKDX repeat protein